MMRTMKIFEPAMCCSTGLCGVSVDPELLRVSTVLNTLKQHGVEVQRFNLTNAPMEFANTAVVADFLQKFGPDKLPVILVDDVIIMAGRYPSNAEFIKWLELPENVLSVEGQCGGDDVSNTESCCCSGEAKRDCSDDNCCC